IYNIDNRSGGTGSGRKNALRLRRTFLGFAAAAAAFSGVCIVNPAFAADIPIVGGIFETLGNSLGFSGDFDKYAEPAGDTEAHRNRVNRRQKMWIIPVRRQTLWKQTAKIQANRRTVSRQHRTELP